MDGKPLKKPLGWRVRAVVNTEEVDTYVLGHTVKDAFEFFYAECERLNRIIVSIHISLR